MTVHPILLIGGSGMVGRFAARFLRDANPGAPILIGGRDLAKARALASELGNAEGVVVDFSAPDLGLEDRPVSAVALFCADPSLAALRYAQRLEIPHLGISTALHAIAPEVAAFMSKPRATTMVLGTEWLVGAAIIPAIRISKEFSRVDEIRIGALIDEQDTGGPEQSLDHERAMTAPPPVLCRRDGAYSWASAEGQVRSFQSADGTMIEGFPMSLVDILGLTNEIGASDVHLHLGVGESSSRRRGEGVSTEIIIEMDGTSGDGKPLRSRHAVIFPGGQLPLTGLGAAVVIERLVGLNGQMPCSPGLYFPYQLLDHDGYLARLVKAGGSVLKLDAL